MRLPTGDFASFRDVFDVDGRPVRDRDQRLQKLFLSAPAATAIDQAQRIADESARGIVKVLTVPGRDRILGVTIAGEHAGDLIIEYILAMRHGIGLDKILGTIHIYPTLAEANKYAAGAWKRSAVTRGQLAFAEAFQEWMRGAASAASVAGRLLRMPWNRQRAFQPGPH